ncbi:serine hydrolase domain-containing protein [Nonomuraea sp. NPDC050663]|uniref:serine hydrolase domain-containing protein n=1 Tax=Nonomuraea sp. NPDC050663 TaxID=3364370 RepID=UPI00379FD940
MSPFRVHASLLTLALTAVTMTGPPSLGPSPVQRALERAVTDGRGPGIVAELRHGHARPWFGTAGVADLASGAARRQDEHFRIGSFTKAFVGVVVVRLADEGTLSLDDTLAKWLPGVVEEYFGADSAKIDVRQLLNHTSGLPDALPGQEPPAPLEPGTRFIYSKVNYTLAGMIVEKATGSTLAAEIDRHLAHPLGLTGTYLPEAGDHGVRAPHARHYSKFTEHGEPAEVHDVTEVDQGWAGAAGGMISTTSDLHRFLAALLRGDLLSPAGQKEMFTTVETADWVPGTRYGLGVYSQTLPSGLTLWGGGGYIQGSTTYAMGDRRATHVLVSNLNGDWNDFVGTFEDLYAAAFKR